MYSNYSIHFYKDSWLLLESLKGSPMPMACLRRPLYSLLESKPKNLKNPIFNFEYITLFI